MNAQEIFDTVARFLIKQGTRSVDKVGKCMYRGEDGRKCAVGCLIPDENHVRGMENKTIFQLRNYYLSELPEYFMKNIDLLSDLQTAHDKSDEDFVATFKRKMRNVAINYKLSDTVLNEQEVDGVVDNRFDPSTWGL